MTINQDAKTVTIAALKQAIDCLPRKPKNAIKALMDSLKQGADESVISDALVAVEAIEGEDKDEREAIADDAQTTIEELIDGLNKPEEESER